MPKTYVSPALRRYGQVSELTASDFKCTPGGDGGFAIWEDVNHNGSVWVNQETGEQTDPFTPPSGPPTFRDCRSGDFTS